MANAIDELLIAIGFEVDDEQAKDASSLMGSLSDEALKLGGILGAGLGLSELTFGFADSTDKMGKFAERMGVAIKFVDQLDYALQREGGSAGEAYREIENLSNLLGKMQGGDYEWMTELSRFGFDPKALQQAKTVPEIMRAISEQFQDLDAQQKQQVANILGLGSAMQRLESGGPSLFSGYAMQLNARGSITDEEAKAAADFNDSVLNLQTTVRGFSKELSEVLLVKLTKGINEFEKQALKAKPVVMDFFGKYGDEIEDAFIGAAVIGAAKLGTKLFSALGGIPNLILSYVVGKLTTMWDWDAEDVKKELGIDLPDFVFKPISEIDPNEVKTYFKETFGFGDEDAPAKKNNGGTFKYGQPVASISDVRSGAELSKPSFMNVPAQNNTVNVTNQITINDAKDPDAVARKVSEDVKNSVGKEIEKFGGNVQ